MKRKKLKRARVIDKELSSLKTARRMINLGDHEVHVRIVDVDVIDADFIDDACEYDKKFLYSELIANELKQSKIVANAIITDSLNRRISKLQSELKSL